jgi:hypothetical protein
MADAPSAATRASAAASMAFSAKITPSESGSTLSYG